jgi:general secretion pathway protein K
MARPPLAARRDQRGVALILVIWVLALMTVLIIGFTGTSHTELLLARNNYDGARAAAIADAGVSVAMVRLLDASGDGQADGRTRVMPFADGSVRVTVQDEAGKVDLNVAPPDLMAGVFQSLGVAGSDATSLANAVVDWRARRKAGMAAATGGDAAEEYGAFLSIDELRLVPGMTRAIYDRLRPYVTVYAPIGRIDPLTAPAEVLRGLPGINPAQLAAFLEARDKSGAVPGALPPLNGVTRFLAHAGLHAATIRAVGQTADGTRFVREAIIVVNGEVGQPYKVVAWRQGRDEDAPP